MVSHPERTERVGADTGHSQKWAIWSEIRATGVGGGACHPSATDNKVGLEVLDESASPCLVVLWICLAAMPAAFDLR